MPSTCDCHSHQLQRHDGCTYTVGYLKKKKTVRRKATSENVAYSNKRYTFDFKAVVIILLKSYWEKQSPM